MTFHSLDKQRLGTPVITMTVPVGAYAAGGEDPDR